MLRPHLSSVAAVLLLVAGGISLAGCQSMKHVKRDYEAGLGVSRTYPVTLEEAWEISRRVLEWEEALAIEEHRDRGFMASSFGGNFVSYGSMAGVWMETAGQDGTKVTVVCKRRLATNFATVMTEGTFHRWFAQAVAILKSGRPLPKTRPTEVDVQP